MVMSGCYEQVNLTTIFLGRQGKKKVSVWPDWIWNLGPLALEVSPF